MGKIREKCDGMSAIDEIRVLSPARISAADTRNVAAPNSAGAGLFPDYPRFYQRRPFPQPIQVIKLGRVLFLEDPAQITSLVVRQTPRFGKKLRLLQFGAAIVFVRQVLRQQLKEFAGL